MTPKDADTTEAGTHGEALYDLPLIAPKRCPVCAKSEFEASTVLWAELIDAWDLRPAEVELVNAQQGLHCVSCLCSLRSMTLAGAVTRAFNWQGSFFDLLKQPLVADLRVLEINEAGDLHPYLRLMPGHEIARYPQIDMQDMALPDESYDLVIHSDTLEHVAMPQRALRECRRVLRPRGMLMMTIPMVPSRLTRRCSPSTPSYHGSTGVEASDWKVVTEYGADFFLELLAAGWDNVSLFTLGSPASYAIVATKSGLCWQGALEPSLSSNSLRGEPDALASLARKMSSALKVNLALGSLAARRAKPAMVARGYARRVIDAFRK